jgi:hypothetical protein
MDLASKFLGLLDLISGGAQLDVHSTLKVRLASFKLLSFTESRISSY